MVILTTVMAIGTTFAFGYALGHDDGLQAGRRLCALCRAASSSVSGF
jgi:hypothetical protein